MSEEHVFGKWLLDFKLETQPVVHTGGGINALQKQQGLFVPFTQTVRAVCRNCNQGWLSALEGDAKQTLTPILEGRATEIPPLAALRLATWAFKTTLVAMLTFPRSERGTGLGVPESEYRALFAAQDRGLPEGTRAWLGRYAGEKVSSIWIVPHALTVDDLEVEAELPQGYGSTLVVGPMVVYVFRWTAPLLSLDIELGISLAKLVPASAAIRWPTAHAASDDEALVQLALGRNLLTGVPHTSLRPWGPAADAPPGELVNGRVAGPVLCGLHTISYPVALVVAAAEGREHVFWGMCACGQAYLIQTETDAAHLRKCGAPAAISSFYDELPGDVVVIEDHLGFFACKRLVRRPSGAG